VLLSRSPLAAEEYDALVLRWDDWMENPYREALRLAQTSPATADKLTLWTAPGRRGERLRTTRSFGVALAVVGGVAILATLVAGVAAKRRRARRAAARDSD